jgi:hypothetical protein
MSFPEHRDSVLRLHRRDDPTTFGTAFVVHVDPPDQAGSTAYLVTCAHVVDDCCEQMMIDTIPVKLVGIGRRDGLDVAVVEVEAAKPWWKALPLVGFGAGQPEISTQCLCAVGYRETDGGFRRIPLNAEFGQYEEVELDDGCELRLIEFRLPVSPSEQPRELMQGYSGSPLLAPCGVFGVVDLREKTAGHGTYKIGTAIPLWHLPKIWPEMPSDVGKKLFGERYWPILEQLRTFTAKCTTDEFCHAFRRVLPDQRPEEYSLWGCALTLARFETEDQPVGRLDGFVRALAELTQRIELLTIPFVSDQPPDDQRPATATGQTYRRLILRISEQRLSARSDRQRGRRYQIQVHTATCETRDGGCCGKDCVDCAPVSAGHLKTVWARSLEDTSESGLRDVLAEEIADMVGIFGREEPDLVQIMAPEGLLSNAIFEMCLDQLQALGPTRLCVLHPTIFSGEGRSNPTRQGRYLLPRIPPSPSRWTGARVRLQAVADDRDLHRQLDPETPAVAVTGKRNIAEQCLYSPVPVIVVADDSVEPVEAVIDNAECLHRLPRLLHAARFSHRLIYDTPSIPIEFAQGEPPHVDGK